MFNAPLKIREDLEFKQQKYKAAREKEYKDVKDPSDLFEVDGRPAENIYMLGEAGRGKTGQCYQLVQHWVEAREANKGSKELSNWQKALVAFDLLFFVSLRHVNNNIHSIIEMICQYVMKTYPQHHNTVRQILISGLYNYKCLIVIDGLDERKGELDIDVDMSRCTVLRTSRHWKFHDLAPDINDMDRVVEVCGLDQYGREQVIEKVLVNYFGIDKKSTEFKTKVSEISKAAADEKYKSIMDIPLLLNVFVHLWQSNTSLQESMTSFYAALLNLLIKLAFDNMRVTKIPIILQSSAKVDFPSLMTKQKKLRYHIEKLVLIGKVAYEDLLFGNQKLGNDEKERCGVIQKGGTSQLVFEKDDLIEKLGGDVLAFALEVGLFSQSSAPGSFDDENVSINFFHKTVEEFLAALYLVCSDEVSFDSSFFTLCSSTERVMELSNILLFTVGLQPEIGSVISEHIAQIAGSDSDIIHYRQGLEENCRKVGMLFNILCDCNQEMKYSLTQSATWTQNNILRVSDVYVDWGSDGSTLAFTKDLLSLDKDNIVSLHVYNSPFEVFIPFNIVKEFLDKTSSLQALCFKTGREIVPTLCSVSPIFSTLTAVSLHGISLTSEAARDLRQAIESNTKLRSFTLLLSTTIHNVLENKDFSRETSASMTKRTDVIVISLDMTINKQLRNLVLQQDILQHTNILLVDITQCKSLINLTLIGVQIQSIDMLQAAFSSFTHLKYLTLLNVSFSDENKEKMCLDLTLCTNLANCGLIGIHVKDVQISPTSLQSLVIIRVSGSLRGLLSSLPQCHHLTDLNINSPCEEQDVKLLTDVLPRLTQVQYMKYDVRKFGDTGNEGVVEYHSTVAQAATRMTGLKYLQIEFIDMGDFALTLTPLMTHIKDAMLWKVRMTASSWGEFIASLLTIQHGFCIQLWGTNIDDESVSAVQSSHSFNVTKNEKGPLKGEFMQLHFSKLSS